MTIVKFNIISNFLNLPNKHMYVYFAIIMKRCFRNGKQIEMNNYLITYSLFNDKIK